MGAESESIQLPGRDNGWLQLRVVPDDNSCLFSAVGVVSEGGMGKDVVKRLRARELVVSFVPLVIRHLSSLTIPLLHLQL